MNRIALGILLTAVITTVSSNSASAATLFTTNLSGANEVPPVSTTGTGFASVSLSGDMLSISLSFSGLTSPDAAGHIHCCGPVGVNEAIALPFTGFPTAVLAGTYSATFDLTVASTYTAAFVTTYGGTASSAETALIAGLNAGEAYANIHTMLNPGGEIRGQLAPVPEPATFWMGGLALAGVAWAKRRSFARV